MNDCSSRKKLTVAMDFAKAAALAAASALALWLEACHSARHKDLSRYVEDLTCALNGRIF